MKSLILPSSGIGDALLMMIVAHHSHMAGYETLMIHPKIHELSSWFPHIRFAKTIEDLSAYDQIFLQNDNRARSKDLIALRKNLPLHVFYTAYKPSKHGALDPLDIVFDVEKTMVENYVIGCKKIFPFSLCSSDTGVLAPQGLEHKKYKKRVILHPTSQEISKNWPAQKFLILAKTLQHHGFDPVFTVSPEEHSFWKKFLGETIALPLLPLLSDLAAFVYESAFFIGNDSGVGHLASCLMIPTLTLAAKKEHMNLWKPGWSKGSVLLPSKMIPKSFHLREKYWTWGLSTNRVFQHFLKEYTLIKN